MAISMTGCGEGIVVDAQGTCRVELRVVNNRFFKFAMRSRDAFAVLEPRIEAVVRGRVRRGTVQMTLDVAGPAVPAGRRIDRGQLAAYLDELDDFCASHRIPTPQSIDGILGLPGILVETPPPSDAIEAVWPLVARGLDMAVDGLERMRRTEGEALTNDMRRGCGEIIRTMTAIRQRIPAVLAEYRARLQERVTKLLEGSGAAVSPSDLTREVALIADRSDVAEELVRLESHVAQFDRLLDEESPGRALDFLSQELAREANTIASKSLDVAVAHMVVELKTHIERLREQVQNIE
ncbi:MAG: YicC family protein [Planctomycetia bacterium]|nr:YicC family protein [Planctomycetia bacterium]